MLMNQLENKVVEAELKYKYARNIVYEGTGTYIYRDIILTAHNYITHIHYKSNENYTRNVRNRYTLNFAKDNEFTHEQLTIIFTHIEFIIEIIKRKIIKLFDRTYEGLEESFEAVYDKNDKTFSICIEYQLVDRLSVDNKNEMITEIIIGTLLAACEELKEINEINALTIIEKDLK